MNDTIGVIPLDFESGGDNDSADEDGEGIYPAWAPSGSMRRRIINIAIAFMIASTAATLAFSVWAMARDAGGPAIGIFLFNVVALAASASIGFAWWHPRAELSWVPQ